jgi:hypothetical protein
MNSSWSELVNITASGAVLWSFWFCCSEGITHLSFLNGFFRVYKEANAKIQPLGNFAVIYATYVGFHFTFITHRFPTIGMVAQSWKSEGCNILANIAFTQGNDHSTCLLVLLVPTGQ